MGFVRPESVKWSQKAMKTSKKARTEPDFRKRFHESTNHTRFCRIFQQPPKAREAVDISDFNAIVVNETSIRRGHNHIPLFMDFNAWRLLFTAPSKDARAFEKFSEDLQAHSGSFETTTEVSMDHSPAFQKEAAEHLSNAQVTFDRFHLMKSINQAVDAVRKSEALSQPDLKKSRLAWLNNPGKLSAKQSARLQVLLKDQNLKTAQAYQCRLTSRVLSYSKLCNPKFGVERFSGFENSESWKLELTHRSNYDLHGAFISKQKSVAEDRDQGIMPYRRQRCQIQRFTQRSISRLSNGRLPRLLTRLMDGGIQASIGDYLFGRMEPVQRAEKGEQGGGRIITDLRNAGQKRLLLCEIGVVVDMVLDLQANDLNLLSNKFENRLYQLPRRAFCGFQPAELYGLQCQKIIQATYQGLKNNDLVGWRSPGRRTVHSAIAGNELGIDLVRLGLGQLGLAEGIDLIWVDHTDQDLLLCQEIRQILSVGAGSFHTQIGFPGPVLVEPIDEVLVTNEIIGKGFAAILPLRGQEGDINAEKRNGLCYVSLLTRDNGDQRTMPVHPYVCRLLPRAGLGDGPNMPAKVRQAIDLEDRIKSLRNLQSYLPRSGGQPKGANPQGLVPRHKEIFTIKNRHQGVCRAPLV